MSSEDFIAHIRTSDGAEQRLVDHLKEVQALAEEIGQKIGLPHVTGLAGMLHDMGKFSRRFRDIFVKRLPIPLIHQNGVVWIVLRQGQIFTETFSPRRYRCIYFNGICG